MANVRSSEIDRMLQDDIEDSDNGESVIEVEYEPSDTELLDFSSGSGEEYAPDFDELDTSDREENPRPNVSNPSSPLRPNTHAAPVVQNPWVRVYPPEPENDIAPLFRVRNPGPKDAPPRNSAPIVYALLFFTAQFWRTVTEQTNAYASKIIQNKSDSGTMKPFSRVTKWVKVTVCEMKKLFALLLNMGLNGDSTKPRRAFWDTRPSQHNSFFANVMSVNRFELIMSNFHYFS